MVHVAAAWPHGCRQITLTAIAATFALGATGAAAGGNSASIPGVRNIYADHPMYSTPAPTQTAATQKADIVDTAAKAGQFNTLVAAVKAAGLAEVLKSDGPFTVFAPTDEAFAKLRSGTLESLPKPENKEKLAAILKYHVVPGKIMTSAVAGKTAMVETAQGSKPSVNGPTA